MVINGVQLEDIDIFDVDCAEKYESALNEVLVQANDTKNLKGSEVIRNQCQAVFNCFDKLFGEGTHEKVFGNKMNIITCLKAFEELIDETNAKKSELDEITAKYSPNRAARRSKK